LLTTLRLSQASEIAAELTWPYLPFWWGRQIMLDDATAGPIYRSAYPALAAMDTKLTFPLTPGGCSEHPPCPVAPFGNEISHNVAVNMAPPTCS
jgi:hypothetical protein